MKRVLHVLTVPMSLGFLRGQAEYMRSRGYELGVTCAEGVALSRFARKEGVWARSIPIARAIAPRGDLKAMSALRRRIREFKPDVVHGHSPKGGLLSMLTAAAHRLPRLYHLRGLPLETASGTTRNLLALAERTTCTLAHRVVAVSPSLRDRAIQLGVLPKGKAVVIGNGSGNGVDTAHFKPATSQERRTARERLQLPLDDVVFTFAGRFTKDKGIPELLAAWSQAKRANRCLLLVGDLDSRAPLTGINFQQPGVQVRPHTDDIRSVYAASDVVVLPTHREGFPNVILEAGAMGLPVIASRATGCIDAVVHEHTGLLVAINSPDELAAAMRRYGQHPDERRSHGSAGRTRVATLFDPHTIHAGIADCYDSLTSTI